MATLYTNEANCFQSKRDTSLWNLTLGDTDPPELLRSCSSSPCTSPSGDGVSVVMKKHMFPTCDEAASCRDILNDIRSINAHEEASFFFAVSFVGKEPGPEVWYLMPRFEYDLQHFIEAATPAECAQVSLPVLTQVAEAMYFLHARDILHLDLKPANVLLSASPGLCACVSDFDSCRRVYAKGGLPLASHTEVVVQDTFHGTPEYAAPEQFMQRPCKASDVWAFGCTALQLCTGEPALWKDQGSQFMVFLQVCRHGSNAMLAMDAAVLQRANEHSAKLLCFVRDRMLCQEPWMRCCFVEVFRQLRDL